MRALAPTLLALLLAACGAEGDLTDRADDLAPRHPAVLDLPTLTPTLPARASDVDLTGRLDRCAADGTPVVTTLRAQRLGQGSIHVEVEGLDCDAGVEGFGFGALDAEGRNVAGRSWPEVDEITVGADGRFSIRGLAWSCGNMDSAVDLEIVVRGKHGDSSVVAAAIEGAPTAP